VLFRSAAKAGVAKPEIKAKMTAEQVDNLKRRLSGVQDKGITARAVCPRRCRGKGRNRRVLQSYGSRAGMTDSVTDPLEAALAAATVDALIVKIILPMAYNMIDQLIDLDGKPIPKKLLIDAKKLLPSEYKNSFQFKAES